MDAQIRMARSMAVIHAIADEERKGRERNHVRVQRMRSLLCVIGDASSRSKETREQEQQLAERARLRRLERLLDGTGLLEEAAREGWAK